MDNEIVLFWCQLKIVVVCTYSTVLEAFFTDTTDLRIQKTTDNV